MNDDTRQMLKMYLIALILTLIAERIGLVKWQLGIITIVLVPFFHTIYLGVALGPKFLGRIVKVMDLKDSAFAGALIIPAVYALMARYGTLVGPNVPKLFQGGRRSDPAGDRKQLGIDRHCPSYRCFDRPAAGGHRGLLFDRP